MSDLTALAQTALDAEGADAVEVHVTRSDTALTRFAESVVHQNTARLDGEARVRVVVDGARVGVVATNDLSPEGLRAAARSAVEAARVTPPDESFAGLASPASYDAAGVDDEATGSASPDDRARLVATMLSHLGAGMVAAGTAESGRHEVAVVNTNGVSAYHASTRASVTCLVSGGDSTGWAEDTSGTLGGIAADAVAARAVAKVEAGRAPRDVEPGDYAVVLEPVAVSALVEWLCWLAFGGRDVVEGRSAISARLGERVCSPLVTVVDDALSPDMTGVPFDAEGVPKRVLPLIENGVARNAAHDLTSARLGGTESTGHAFPAPNPQGGFPAHPRLHGGDASLDDLVGGLERGLLVTRFHYTNAVHALSTTITGMTRDGTFLVEDGRVVGGVHNLRFTQSVLDALSCVEAVGRDTALGSEFGGAVRAPALRLSRFHFSSATSF
ncbi:MAG TPA: TldD/PmbA family protein [Frankiaceae bacterium]|jgi:predicted Zn-dependent protease|nr:TldD/PmbA family protein [Frankiaceae bacterium]